MRELVQGGLLGVILSLALTQDVLAEKVTKIAVAVIDMQKVIAESAPGKKARDNLDAFVKKAETGLEAKRTELERLKKDLETKKSALSAAATEEKLSQIDKKEKEFQRAIQDFREELAKKNRDEIGKIVKQIRDIVKKIAQEKEISVVLERGGPAGSVVWNTPDVDISTEVLEAL